MGIHDLDDDWGYAPDDEGYPDILSMQKHLPGDEKSQQYLKVSAWGSALRDENHSWNSSASHWWQGKYPLVI